jgi:23S rRNA (uracil1939-C5)-methyltransferase
VKERGFTANIGKMRKHEIVNVKIEDMGTAGEGIGKVDGFPLFIKGAIIGDEVRVKITKLNKNYGFAQVEEVIKPSEFRVESRCPIARSCGGCQLQEMEYTKQLEFKENKVFQHLRRIGGFSEELLSQVIEPIVGMDNPYNYRNKVAFPFGTDEGGEIITGFYADRTHNIIPTTDCVVGAPVNKEIMETIISYMKRNKVTAYDKKKQRGVVRHVLIRYGFKSREIMVVLVVNSKNSSVLSNVEELVKSLVEIPKMTGVVVNFNTQSTSLILGEKYEVLWGEGYITDYLTYGEEIEKEFNEDVKEIERNKGATKKDIKYRISPLSFYQVNPIQTEKLYALVLEYGNLKGSEIVWDLYCGIGTISLFLSQKSRKVIGVEIVSEAIKDAKENARINGIKNVEFMVGKSEEVFGEYYEDKSEPPDVVVLDPPRKGCDVALLTTIAKVKPEKVIVVSCDSATLARDLKYLCEDGYELRRVRAVDLFPMTVNVECVTLLVRKECNELLRE